MQAEVCQPGFQTRLTLFDSSCPAITAIPDAFRALRSVPLGAAPGTYGDYAVTLDTGLVAASEINFGDTEPFPNNVTEVDIGVVSAYATVAIPAGRWDVQIVAQDGAFVEIDGVTFTDFQVAEDEFSASDTFGHSGVGQSLAQTASFSSGKKTTTLRAFALSVQNSTAIDDSFQLFISPSGLNDFVLLADGVFGWRVWSGECEFGSCCGDGKARNEEKKYLFFRNHFVPFPKGCADNVLEFDCPNANQTFVAGGTCEYDCGKFL